jgi:hypothetical protein
MKPCIPLALYPVLKVSSEICTITAKLFRYLGGIFEHKGLLLISLSITKMGYSLLKGNQDVLYIKGVFSHIISHRKWWHWRQWALFAQDFKSREWVDSINRWEKKE